MAVLTGKIEWRAATANKSSQRMLEILRDFIVTTAGWTLLADQIGAGANDAYFVVTKDRGTGYAGDNPIIQVAYYDGVANPNYVRTPSIYFVAYSAWSGTTGTNPTPVVPAAAGYYGSNGLTNKWAWGQGQVLAFSPLYDTDFYISVDTTGKFILATSKVLDYQNYHWLNNGRGVVSSPVLGVTCFERLTGDTSSGSFYGLFDSTRLFNSNYFGVPVRWDNVVSSSGQAYFSVGTRLGNGYSTLRNVNEAGKHVMLDLEARRQDFNKVKGKLFGVALTTETSLFQHHTLFPSIAAPQWLITKMPSDFGGSHPAPMEGSPYNLAMQTGSTITLLS